MSEGAASQGEVRFAPGAAAPTAADRRAHLQSPEVRARMEAGRLAWNALPKEERARRRADKKAEKSEKQAKKDAREAEKVAKRRGAAPPPSEAPDTVRSERMTSMPPPAAVPDSPALRRAVLGKLQGLLDLVAYMTNLGDGSCFIQVERIKPTVSDGMPCQGVQRPIREPLDDAEFAMVYGGSEYRLRGYEYLDDGRARPCTDPVPYKVPGRPNPESALTEEDTDMRPQQAHAPNGSPFMGRRGAVAPHVATAEAEMHDRNLTHQETMDERDERRKKEREERAAQGARDARRAELDQTRILMEARDKEVERLAEAHERELAARNQGPGLGEIAQLIQTLKPGDDTAALARQHSAEIRSLTEGHKTELLRITESHREELSRLMVSNQAALQRVEDQARADRQRGDELVREAERRANDQIREVQRAADQRVTDAQNTARTAYEDLRSRSEERLRDQSDQWQRRFEDLKEANSRELRSKESEITLMRTGLEGNYAVILQGKDNEIKRLHQDVRQAKDEAEKNKDWVGKVKELGEQAEAMGYTKTEPGEGGEEDTKTMVIKGVLQAAQRLPEMIQAGSNAIAQMKNPGVPPDQARSQARAGAVRSGMRTVPRSHQAPMLMSPLTFSSEGGADYVPPAGAYPPSQPPLPPPQFQQNTITQTGQQQIAPLDPPSQAIMVDPGIQQQAAQQPAQETTASVPPATVLAAASPPPHPTQSGLPPEFASPRPATASVPPPAPATNVKPIDQQYLPILEIFTPTLAGHFEQRVPPETVAQSIVTENGVEVARVALEQVRIEQFLEHLRVNAAAFPQLASRAGQKFLRAVWQHAEQLVSQ